ncbi:MAG: hypothetical protein ACI8RD_003655 [Bacillariaceae sp.]|jgi:hypothetical protein
MNDLRFLLRYSMRGMFFVDLMIMYRVYILVLQSTSSTKNIDRPSKRERKLDGMPCAFNCQVNASVEVFLAVCLYYCMCCKDTEHLPTVKLHSKTNEYIYFIDNNQEVKSKLFCIGKQQSCILFTLFLLHCTK